MDPRFSASALTETNDASVPGGGEPARKRRRLNTGGPTQSARQDVVGAVSSVGGIDGWPASNAADYVQIVGESDMSTHNAESRTLSIDDAVPLPSAFDIPRRQHELPFGLREATAIEPTRGRASLASSPTQATYGLAGDRDLPFGVLYNPHLSTSQAGPEAQSHDIGNSAHDTDGLEAIDLTTINDGSELRAREQLDEAEKQLRKDAAIKIEARKKANAEMLKSTLEQQQADPANADDRAGGKGIGSMQCVICMDSFTDMTATHCGHLFCHTCINEHLITAELSRGYPSTKALCPFCRTPVYRKATRKTEKEKGIVPLIFKVKSRIGSSTVKGQQRQIETVD